MHLFLARAIGSPDYRVAAIWWCGAAIGLFWRFGHWAIVAPFAALALPVSLRKLRKLIGDVRQRA
jgi:PST family polysaccharide transporter